MVGERLAEMGIPDHICAAVEIVCEVADEEGIDPRLSPVEGSVHPEYLAAVVGWLKITGNGLPKIWLRRFASHEDDHWFIHREHKPIAERAGIRVEIPRSCYSFKRPAHAFPIDPPPNALLFKNRES